MKSTNNRMRYDLQIIASWIEPGSQVIDLGCGEGDLLQHLITHKGVHGTGIECNEEKVAHCIEKGLSVLQGISTRRSMTIRRPFRLRHSEPDPATGLRTSGPHPRHAAHRPERIVSFPNFSHWDIRRQGVFTGFAPVSRQLPFQWFNTPNIRVITLKDFRKFVDDVGFKILKEAAINTHSQDRYGSIVQLLNLRATYGIFMIGKQD
jgi:hypothetical protein